MSFHNTIVQTLNKELTNKGKSEIQRVHTDSRTIQPGDLFIPLSGENFNGHDFITDAIKKGAAGIIYSDKNALPIKNSEELWTFQVSSTITSYQTLANAYLKTKKCIKIAITGTSGKTSTKEFLKTLLSAHYSVFATYGNLNNQVGVPLSVFQVKDEDIAIFELGAGEPGDIIRLSKIIEPDICLVSSVGEGHLEFFKDTESVAQEKSSICYKDESDCFCPKSILHPKYFQKFQKVDSSSLFNSIELKEDGYQLELNNQKIYFPFWGKYNLFNFSLAVQTALHLNLRTSEIAVQAPHCSLPGFRQKKVKKNNIDFYLDCYNANPLSMSEAIKAFTKLPGNNKICILGDMLELGNESPRFHKELGLFLTALNFQSVIFIGKEMIHAFKAYKNNGFYFENNTKAAEKLKDIATKGSQVLVKASRGMKLEEIFEMF